MSDKQLTFRCVDTSAFHDGLFLSNFSPLHPRVVANLLGNVFILVRLVVNA
jgi:hypothetical protein